ncbi:MAG: hypothetical protein V1734_02060 [Nanoarchaeota archaeon]
MKRAYILLLLVLLAGCAEKQYAEESGDGQAEDVQQPPAEGIEPEATVQEKVTETPAEPPAPLSLTEENNKTKEHEKPALPSDKYLSWQKEEGTRVWGGISSCTILQDGKYLMYYTREGGIWLASSPEGISFEEKGIVFTPGENQPMASNPSVFKLQEKGYRMIYESNEDMGTVRKLRSAVSEDGFAWTGEEGIRLEDSIYFEDKKKGASGEVIFASVPDVIRLDSGCLRIYYAAIDEIRFAESCDEGLNWNKKGKVKFDIRPEIAQDPDTIRLGDGTYKLFFSVQNSDRTAGWIESASSEDGINFKLDAGKRIEPTHGEKHAMDIDVIKLPDGTYRAYYSEGTLPNPKPNILSAISRE